MYLWYLSMVSMVTNLIDFRLFRRVSIRVPPGGAQNPAFQEEHIQPQVSMQDVPNSLWNIRPLTTCQVHTVCQSVYLHFVFG